MSRWIFVASSKDTISKDEGSSEASASEHHQGGVRWCTIPGQAMSKRRNAATRRNSGSIRASISFPSEVYDELEQIAEAKNVSLAWVIREAAEKYLTEQ